MFKKNFDEVEVQNGKRIVRKRDKRTTDYKIMVIMKSYVFITLTIGNDVVDVELFVCCIHVSIGTHETDK